MREGTAKGLALHRGLVVRTGILRFTNALQVMPAAWRVRAPLLTTGAVLLSMLAFSGLQGTALMAMMVAVVLTFLLHDRALHQSSQFEFALTGI